jgi:glycosyltransferase involved in cell wall biosynthesis
LRLEPSILRQMTNTTPRTRLCLASPLFYPTYGGAQLRYRRYLPGLRERGLDIQVFAGTAGPEDMTPEDVSARWKAYRWGAQLPIEQVDGTPVHRVRLPNRKDAVRRWFFNQSLYRHCRNPQYRPEVLQLLGTIRIGSIPWIWALKRLGIAALYSVTTASKVTRQTDGVDIRLARFRVLFNTMDCIVTNNRPLAEALREMGVVTRVEIIANGVDLERFSPSAEPEATTALRGRLGIGPDELMILAVGAVMPRKGSDLLINAWSRLNAEHPNTHLVFVGPRHDSTESHHESFQDEIDRRVAASGAPERIHFVGLTEDVPSYLRAADIFALPSKREGMPNAVLEAMACRKPVVMTPFEGLSDDLGHPGRQYLLTDHDLDALSRALLRLVEDRELRDSLAEQGWRWIRENMSLERSVARYAELYEELAALARNRTPA